jgi:uncharacterized protein
MPQRVVIKLVHQRDQLAEFAGWKAFARKPAQIVAGQVGQQPSLVLPVRHLAGDEQLQVFGVHSRVKVMNPRLSRARGLFANALRLRFARHFFGLFSMQADDHDWQARFVALATAHADNDGAHDLNHLHRVWQAARTLLAQYPAADALVVQAACYLHDMVNLPKDHPDRKLASRQAAALACKTLAANGFPAQKLDAVAHAIEAHSFSAAITPQTIEAKIVQDADRLDALGAVGLARLYYIAGRMGSALAHPDDPLAQHRALDDRAYALDHIEAKLAKLPATMQTQAGRELGEDRLRWLRAFRATFIAEWGQPG